MSDNTDSAAKVNGDLSATQPPSSQKAAPNSSVDVEAIVKALESRIPGMLEPTITEIVEKQWQSGKDKRFTKVEEHDQKIAGFESQLARLEELQAEGLSKKQALWQMKMEDNLTSIAAKPPESTVGSQKSEAIVSDPLIQSVFSSWGIEPNSADFLELVKTSTGKKDDLLQKGFDLYQRRKNASTLSPSKEMVVPQPEGSPSSSDNIDSMTARLQELQANPAKNMKEIRELTGKIEASFPAKKK